MLLGHRTSQRLLDLYEIHLNIFNIIRLKKGVVVCAGTEKLRILCSRSVRRCVGSKIGAGPPSEHCRRTLEQGTERFNANICAELVPGPGVETSRSSGPLEPQPGGSRVCPGGSETTTFPSLVFNHPQLVSKQISLFSATLPYTGLFLVGLFQVKV